MAFIYRSFRNRPREKHEKKKHKKHTRKTYSMRQRTRRSLIYSPFATYM